MFFLFSILVIHKIYFLYVIELFYPFVGFDLSIYWVKVSHGESLESRYQFDGKKKVYDVITSVSFVNTVNNIKLIYISKPHQVLRTLEGGCIKQRCDRGK